MSRSGTFTNFIGRTVFLPSRKIKLKSLLSFCSVFCLLSACESQIMYKSGGEALIEGDIAAINGNDYNAAYAHYQEAYQASSSPEIKGQAAYNMALIARKQGRQKLFQTNLQQAVNQGLPAAQLELAELYEKTGRSREKIKALYLPFADTSAGASFGLLKISLKEGNLENTKLYARKTEKLLLAQIASGDADGGKSLMLARLYAQHGTLFGEPKDAEVHFREAIAKGNVRAAEELAKYWLETGHNNSTKEDAFSLMLQAAKAGNQDAIEYVASAYETGKGTPVNAKQAQFWYSKLPEGRKDKDSSDIDNAYSRLDKIKDPAGNLAAISQQELASKLKGPAAQFQKSAAKGSLEAMLMVDSLQENEGLIYEEYYKKTPHESLFSAAKKHAKRYRDTYPEAIRKQYMIAAQFGSAKAAMRLAQNAESARNKVEAAKWYKQAAIHGDSEAMLLLARRAKIGEGQPPNEEEAFSWFLKAAEAGAAEGQYEAGLAYMRGNGVEKDIKKAKHWLQKAQAGGYVLAIEVLESIK